MFYIEEVLKPMVITAFILIALGLSKVVDIIIWIVHHVTILIK